MITGAAAIMMAVFVAFAGAPIATVSQLGVGLTVAVLLDATVVRIVLLPALMLLIGDRVWWLPSRLAAGDAAAQRLSVGPALRLAARLLGAGLTSVGFEFAVQVSEAERAFSFFERAFGGDEAAPLALVREFLVDLDLEVGQRAAAAGDQRDVDVEAGTVAFLVVVADRADQDQGRLDRRGRRRCGGGSPACRPAARR